MIDISAQPSQQSVRYRYVVPSVAAAVVPRAPKAVLPYLQLARLHAPIGSWLYLLPGLWGIALASAGLPHWRHAAFALGAGSMRGFGCTVNDLADREVERPGGTDPSRGRSRPVRSTVTGAVVFARGAGGGGCCSCWPAASVPGGGARGRLLSAGGRVPIHEADHLLAAGLAGDGLRLLHPRGLARGGREGSRPPRSLLYVAGFFWTLGYDTIYAHQDKADDVQVGVKSLALRLGRATRPWVAGFYGVTVAGIVAAGAVAGSALDVLRAVSAGRGAAALAGDDGGYRQPRRLPGKVRVESFLRVARARRHRRGESLLRRGHAVAPSEGTESRGLARFESSCGNRRGWPRGAGAVVRRSGHRGGPPPRGGPVAHPTGRADMRPGFGAGGGRRLPAAGAGGRADRGFRRVPVCSSAPLTCAPGPTRSSPRAPSWHSTA